jgi:hypothetical protein
MDTLAGCSDRLMLSLEGVSVHRPINPFVRRVGMERLVDNPGVVSLASACQLHLFLRCWNATAHLVHSMSGVPCAAACKSHYAIVDLIGVEFELFFEIAFTALAVQRNVFPPGTCHR